MNDLRVNSVEITESCSRPAVATNSLARVQARIQELSEELQDANLNSERRWRNPRPHSGPEAWRGFLDGLFGRIPDGDPFSHSMTYLTGWKDGAKARRGKRARNDFTREVKRNAAEEGESR